MYASRTCQVYELECLAIVWAVELFSKYIESQDYCSPKWMRTRTENARIMRWVMRLQEFDLDIQHRKGTSNANVDGLTRDSTASTAPYGEEPIETLYENSEKLS